MRVVDQDIPSELYVPYRGAAVPQFRTLQTKFGSFLFSRRKFGSGSDRFIARKRSAFRRPSQQNSSLHCPSEAQLLVRRAFLRSVLAFNMMSPHVSWIDEYGIGPESRSFWYTAAAPSGWWYFNYYMSIAWRYAYTYQPWALTRFHDFDDTFISSGEPDTNFSASTKLWAGFVAEEEHPWEHERRILIGRRHSRRGPNQLSCLFLEPLICETGIRIFAAAPSVNCVPSVTWNTQPAQGVLLGEYSKEYLLSGKLIPIVYNDSYFNLRNSLFDCIIIVTDFLPRPPLPKPDYWGCVFAAKEYVGAEHASLCP